MIAATTCLLFAAVTAWLLASKRREHRPVAVFLTGALLAVPLGLLARRWMTGPRPFTGWARVSFHADQALQFGYIVGVVGLAWVAFLRRPPWPAVLAWALLVAICAQRYPGLRDAPLIAVHQWASVAAGLAVLIIAAATWTRGAWESEHIAAVGLGTTEIIMLLGPYIGSEPVADWWTAQLTYALVFGILGSYQGALSWRKRSAN